MHRGHIPSLVLRVPMVLGEGDYAAASLLKNARKRTALTFRGESMEQPIYAGDVVDAVLAGLATDAPTGVLELAGPQALPRSDLIAVASAVGTRTVSLPLALGYAAAALLGALSSNPPLTADMLGVLDHDDDHRPGTGRQGAGHPAHWTDRNPGADRIAFCARGVLTVRGRPRPHSGG